jgi:hypothetical protein
MAKKVKPILVLDKSKFIDFMVDGENGIEISDIKKVLKKKGNFNLTDVVRKCGYITNDIIKNKIPKKLRLEVDGLKYFEVQPSDFNIVFV